MWRQHKQQKTRRISASAWRKHGSSTKRQKKKTSAKIRRKYRVSSEAQYIKSAA